MYVTKKCCWNEIP